MNRISEKFKELKKEGKKAFIPYITAGDPSLSMTEKLVFELEKRGSNLIELGIPFSDPLADGPTIQRASERALKNGTTLANVINLVKKIRSEVKIPLVFMTYYNPVFKYGLEKFAADSKEAGVDAVIIPDLPPEEADEWIKFARSKNIDTIFLLSPTSNYDRINRIINVSRGFIYYVSLTGVTGERKKLESSIKEYIIKIKRLAANTPICVGFGISKRQHIEELNKLPIDGVIVGSAIVKVIENNKDSKSLIKKVGNFVTELING